MNKPHVHAEVIKAWADGAKIQFFSKISNKWEDVHSPDWYLSYEYRIKTSITHRIGNIYKSSDGTKLMITCCSNSEVVMCTIDGPFRGCRASDSVKVKNIWSITEEEFSEIVGGHVYAYTLIETND